MPYSIPDGGIAVVTFEGRVMGQQMLTVTHWRLDKEGGTTDGGAFLGALLDAMAGVGGLHTKFMAAMSEDYTALRLRGQWILPERHAYVDRSPIEETGSVPSEIMGPNVAVTILKRTELAGGHGRGVTHMPGVPKSFVTAGTLNAFGRGSYEDFGGAVSAPIALLGGDAVPVLYNRTTPGDSPEITGYSINPDVRTMHRRTVGLGS